MKHGAWFWLTGGLGLLLAGPTAAQSLAGTWQGVEFTPGAAPANCWPQVLTLRAGPGAALTGELYQEAGNAQARTVTVAVRGTRTATGLRLRHVRVLTESDPDELGWCLGTLVFTYDAAKELLVGRSTYTGPDCFGGPTEFSRVVLKSAATVAPAVPSTVRVSGRNVRWFADAALRRPLATGNTYRTSLRKATTFYLTQGFYATRRSPVAAVTVRVARPVPLAPAVAVAVVRAAPLAPLPPLAVVLVAVPAAVVAAAPAPLLGPPATAPAAALAATPPGAASRSLPTVLFHIATAELLPTAAPALDSLAAVLRRYPAVRFRIEGHTDRLGEADKNLTLSQQRADAVKAFLVRAGTAPDRLETIGYGDARPIFVAPNPGNRRVDVRPLPPSK